MSVADNPEVGGFLGGPLGFLSTFVGGFFGGGTHGAPGVTATYPGRGVPPIPGGAGGFNALGPNNPFLPVPRGSTTPPGIGAGPSVGGAGGGEPISIGGPKTALEILDDMIRKYGDIPYDEIPYEDLKTLKDWGITAAKWAAEVKRLLGKAPVPSRSVIRAIPSERPDVRQPMKIPGIDKLPAPPIGAGPAAWAIWAGSIGWQIGSMLYPFLEQPLADILSPQEAGLPMPGAIGGPPEAPRPPEPPQTAPPATPSVPFDFTLGLPAAPPELPPRPGPAPPPAPVATTPTSSPTVPAPSSATPIPLWQQLLPIATGLLAPKITNITNQIPQLPPQLSQLLNIPQLPANLPLPSGFPGFNFSAPGGAPGTQTQTQTKGLTASKTPSASCTCADGQSPKRKRDECAQGYFRQKPGRETEYTVWSQRKCQQSSQKSQSQPVALTQTSLRARPSSSRGRRSLSASA